MSETSGGRVFSFSHVSGAVGLVSGVLGIIQFVQEKGESLVDAAWNGLYYAGFIAMLTFIAMAVLGPGVCWLLEKTGVVRDSAEPSKILDWTLFLGAIVVGVAVGIPMANDNLELLQKHPIEFIGRERPFPPALIRLIGVGAIGLALLAPFTGKIQAWSERQQQASPPDGGRAESPPATKEPKEPSTPEL